MLKWIRCKFCAAADHTQIHFTHTHTHKFIYAYIQMTKGSFWSCAAEQCNSSAATAAPTRIHIHIHTFADMYTQLPFTITHPASAWRAHRIAGCVNFFVQIVFVYFSCCGCHWFGSAVGCCIFAEGKLFANISFVVITLILFYLATVVIFRRRFYIKCALCTIGAYACTYKHTSAHMCGYSGGASVGRNYLWNNCAVSENCLKFVMLPHINFLFIFGYRRHTAYACRQAVATVIKRKNKKQTYKYMQLYLFKRRIFLEIAQFAQRQTKPFHFKYQLFFFCLFCFCFCFYLTCFSALTQSRKPL